MYAENTVVKFMYLYRIIIIFFIAFLYFAPSMYQFQSGSPFYLCRRQWFPAATV